MSKDVFLVPITFPEFERTVLNKIDLTKFHVDDLIVGEVPSPTSTRVWGVKNSTLNKRFYDKMESGDWLLFYHDDKYRYAGKVGVKFESGLISDEFWSGIDADMLYTVDSFAEIDLSRERLNQVCEYKKSFQPQSIRRISNRAYRNIRLKESSVDEFVFQQ
ncbi:hypothetical protein [Haloferax volcanii]|uniref:hypothetical protein n=1 Tax=Haloferax volcanii TaxID=2246 RepID=UPI00385458E5